MASDIAMAAEEWLRKARGMTVAVCETSRALPGSMTVTPAETIRREYEIAEFRRQLVVIDYLLLLVSKPKDH